MTSRFRLALFGGGLSLAMALAGCGDSFNAGPMRYVESARLTSEFKDPPKPKLQSRIREAMANLFGPDPQNIRVPEGSGLPGGGIYLANYLEPEAKDQKRRPIHNVGLDASGKPVQSPQAGGYALYRLHCLHCHGVSGAGDGPTSAFLYPRPRDYRKGLFKFTSTPTGVKPTREDLRKTIKHGLHGTSMPAFEALMTGSETEQVIDYLIFLSMRGETEIGLIEEASISDDNDPEALADDVVAGISKAVSNKWKAAESQVLNPPVPRTPPDRSSVLRGRELFLGRNTAGNKVDCTSCHGPRAVGNGPSFVAQGVFNDVVFGGDPSLQEERLKKYDDKTREQWKNSLDDWGNAIRPANLNRGVYKGGRRPIDLYWRIAKGINGAKMPAHFPTLEPERIWDLVNFVLELPFEPALLEGAKLPAAPPLPLAAPKVARR